MTRILAALLAALAAAATTGLMAQSPVVRDGTGRVLGYYTGPMQGVRFGVRVMSQQGYFFGVRQNGEISDVGENPNGSALLFGPEGPGIANFFGLWFESTDCTGQAYFRFADVEGPWAAGIVIQVDQALFYTPPRTLPVTPRNLRSRSYGGTQCQPENSDGVLSPPAFPNNPDITGVPSDPIPPPIRIVAAGNVNALFSNSFEGPA